MLVLDCLVLVLLVLVQLPKKEAGAGLAFGGGATDALFGAGSGNALTKATKYAAVAFFALSLALSVMEIHHQHSPDSSFEQQLREQQSKPAVTRQPVAVPPVTTSTNAAGSLLAVPAESTNVAPKTP